MWQVSVFAKIKTMAFTESLSTLDSLVCGFLGVFLPLRIYFCNEDLVSYFMSARYFSPHVVIQRMLFCVVCGQIYILFL